MPASCRQGAHCFDTLASGFGVWGTFGVNGWTRDSTPKSLQTTTITHAACNIWLVHHGVDWWFWGFYQSKAPIQSTNPKHQNQQHQSKPQIRGKLTSLDFFSLRPLCSQLLELSAVTLGSDDAPGRAGHSANRPDPTCWFPLFGPKGAMTNRQLSLWFQRVSHLFGAMTNFLVHVSSWK